MAREQPGQTLQTTALVHEAYLRLVDVHKAQRWNSRGHFFAAAARSVVVQPDGKILVAGFAGSGGSQEFALARYNPTARSMPALAAGEVCSPTSAETQLRIVWH